MSLPWVNQPDQSSRLQINGQIITIAKIEVLRIILYVWCAFV